MKNKRGYTLIELLAVIVILAIIALIATPIILNMIENAKKGAAKDSAYGYIEAIDFQNSMSGIDDEKYKMVGPGEDLDVTGLDVKVKGSKPDSGKILLDGQDITNLSIDERANLGISFAFQQPVKFKGITVYDLIKLSSGKDITKADACNILGKVGLCAKEYVDREINSSLSGGELKRIEIATVAVRKSKFTIFDEPEAGIDLWSFNNLIKVFEDLRETTKGTTLIISHQERILNIADQLVLMNSGKIENVGAKEDLFDKVVKDKVCCKLGGTDNE